jgi:hypothetical protein
MYRSFAALACVLAAALSAAACDNGPDNAPTPTPGTPVTETFTGNVTLNGSKTHTFSAAASGAVTATITALDPSGQVVGFQLGTFNGATCSAVLSNDLATVASVLSGTTQSAASLCLKVHDPNGALTDITVAYTVTVSHF